VCRNPRGRPTPFLVGDPLPNGRIIPTYFDSVVLWRDFTPFGSRFASASAANCSHVWSAHTATDTLAVARSHSPSAGIHCVSCGITGSSPAAKTVAIVISSPFVVAAVLHYIIFSTSATGLRGFLKYGWADLPTAMTDMRTSFSGMPSMDLTFASSRMPIMRVSHPWFFAARMK